VTIGWVWIDIRIYCTLKQLVTPLDESLWDTTGFHGVTVFTSRCLLAASKHGRSLSSRFPNCPRPQLSASHGNNLVKVTLRLTVSRSACHGSETYLVLMTRLLLLSVSSGFVDVWSTLWRGNWCVVYNCCWASPAQSFTGWSPERLTTIF
jgi:hypothetical protein